VAVGLAASVGVGGGVGAGVGVGVEPGVGVGVGAGVGVKAGVGVGAGDGDGVAAGVVSGDEALGDAGGAWLGRGVALGVAAGWPGGRLGAEPGEITWKSIRKSKPGTVDTQNGETATSACPYLERYALASGTDLPFTASRSLPESTLAASSASALTGTETTAPTLDGSPREIWTEPSTTV
jgi:hypothetical protein